MPDQAEHLVTRACGWSVDLPRYSAGCSIAGSSLIWPSCCSTRCSRMLVTSPPAATSQALPPLPTSVDMAWGVGRGSAGQGGFQGSAPGGSNALGDEP